MSDADVKMPPLPEPAAWRWPVRKLRGVEWRYTLYETRRNAVPLYTADQLRAAVLAERERCAKLADEYATWGGSNFAKWFRKCAAAIREGTP